MLVHYVCQSCGKRRARHHRAKKCDHCKSQLVRVDATDVASIQAQLKSPYDLAVDAINILCGIANMIGYRIGTDPENSLDVAIACSARAAMWLKENH